MLDNEKNNKDIDISKEEESIFIDIIKKYGQDSIENIIDSDIKEDPLDKETHEKIVEELKENDFHVDKDGAVIFDK